VPQGQLTSPIFDDHRALVCEMSQGLAKRARASHAFIDGSSDIANVSDRCCRRCSRAWVVLKVAAYDG
jgi:hypothetical protein